MSQQTPARSRDLFDFSQWPIVVARMPGFQEFRMDDWTGGFEDVLARQESFVIVLELEEFLKDPRESAEEKKKGALWMKRHRASYRKWCRGNVYVVADPDRRAAVLAETSKQGKAFGFPFLAGADLDEALAIARRLLQ